MTADNIFSAVLTFSLMAGGTVAFGADLLRTPEPKAATQTVTLPNVTVVGKRFADADRVTLPTVTVIGRRVAPTQVAAETQTARPRVQ